MPFRPFAPSLRFSSHPHLRFSLSFYYCSLCDTKKRRYEKYVDASDGGRGGGPDGHSDAFGEAHSLLLGKLAALQTRCDEAAAASDRAVRAGINADIR